MHWFLQKKNTPVVTTVPIYNVQITLKKHQNSKAKIYFHQRSIGQKSNHNNYVPYPRFISLRLAIADLMVIFTRT